MRRFCVLLFIIFLFLVLINMQTSYASGTVLRFDPADVVLGPDYCVGETFTLAAKIDDVEDLAGFDLIIEWNTSFLDYVDHLAKVGVETYPDGILNEPVLIFKNEANATLGQYRLAARILSLPSFYGSGIAFEITLRVKYQPAEPEPNINTSVVFITHPMAGSGAVPIDHSVVNCSLTIISFHPADINDDLVVDIYDIVLGVNAYGSIPGDPHWNPDCDIAEPYGRVDLMDIVMIAMNYGEEYGT